MESFYFGREHGSLIESYGSAGATVSHLLQHKNVSIVTIYLERGGLLGMHPAAADQLFLVTAGSGEATAGIKRCALSPGTAVLWREGQEHETRAGPDGLAAVVVEGRGLAGAVVVPVAPDSASKSTCP